MPEGARRRQALRAGTPVRAGTVTLLPIECVMLRSGRLWCLADKHPYALIVRDARETRVVGIGGTAGTLAALIEEVPGLGAALASM